MATAAENRVSSGAHFYPRFFVPIDLIEEAPGKRNAPPGPGGPLKVPGWCVSKTVGRRPRYGTGLHWKPPPYDAPRSRQFQYSSRLSKKVTVRELCEPSRLVATAAEERSLHNSAISEIRWLVTFRARNRPGSKRATSELHWRRGSGIFRVKK